MKQKGTGPLHEQRHDLGHHEQLWPSWLALSCWESARPSGSLSWPPGAQERQSPPPGESWRRRRERRRPDFTLLYMGLILYARARTFRGCVFSPTEPRARWMELDHVDLKVVPTCWRVGAALHFLLLQVRGHVVVREEHGLQLAHIGQGGICKIRGHREFFSEVGSGSFTIPFFTN